MDKKFVLSQIITTDASLAGWGAVCGDQSSGSRWNPQELGHHINYLKLLAAFHGLKSFCKDVSKSRHIQIRTDNTCALSHLNSMGGIKSPLCNDPARQIWI